MVAEDNNFLKRETGTQADKGRHYSAKTLLTGVLLFTGEKKNKCFCNDQYRKWAFPWINFLLNFWRKEKKNQVNFCLHQEIVCSANVKYFPIAMTELQNNYSEVILLRRQSFFGSSHESSVV